MIVQITNKIHDYYIATDKGLEYRTSMLFREVAHQFLVKLVNMLQSFEHFCSVILQGGTRKYCVTIGKLVVNQPYYIM